MNAAPQLPDLSKWLNDAEAAGRLGVSYKTLERDKALHPQHRPVPGRRAERVWDPEQIQARMPAPPSRAMQVVSTVRTPVSELSEPSNLPAVPAMGPEAMQAVIMRLVEMVAEATRTPKPFITLQEAAEATGLSKGLLRRLIAEGSLRGFDDTFIKVCREDLEELDLRSALVKPAKKKGKR